MDDRPVYKRLWLWLVVMACLLLPWGLVLVASSKSVTFRADVFINEYLRFVGSLLAVGCSFLLVYAVWHADQRRDRVGRLVRSVEAQFRRLGVLSDDITLRISALARSDEWIKQADVELGQCRLEMEALNTSIDVFLTSNFVADGDPRAELLFKAWTETIRAPLRQLLSSGGWTYSSLALSRGAHTANAALRDAIRGIVGEDG